MREDDGPAAPRSPTTSPGDTAADPLKPLPPAEVTRAGAVGAELVIRMRRGDPGALRELLRFLEPFVGRWCGPIALQDGPDAAQETLIVVFRRIYQLRDPAALLGWVRAIAVREAVKVAGKARRVAASDLADLPTRAEMELAGDVHDILSRLSPEHRAVLVLRDLEDLDEKTVGAILGVSTGTVKSRLFRARRNFRRLWAD